MRHLLKLLLLAALFLTPLFGCDGDDGDDAVVTPANTTTTITGVVADPAISGATVTVMDASGSTLATAATGTTGAYTVNVSASAAKPYRLKVTGGTDTGLNKPLTGEYYAVSSDARIHVSPLTTLVYNAVVAKDSTLATANETRRQVLDALGLTKLLDDNDPAALQPTVVATDVTGSDTVLLEKALRHRAAVAAVLNSVGVTTGDGVTKANVDALASLGTNLGKDLKDNGTVDATDGNVKTAVGYLTTQADPVSLVKTARDALLSEAKVTTAPAAVATLVTKVQQTPVSPQAKPASSDKKPTTYTLKIAETTDIHGQYFPYDFIKKAAGKNSQAHAHAFIEGLRAEPGVSNEARGRVILVDNGDILQGQPSVYYYNFENPIDATHEHLEASVMNFMKYDAAVVGNHDIEAGHAVYDPLRLQFNFPWLSANSLRKSGKASDDPAKDANTDSYFKPYTVINCGTPEGGFVRVAILGLTTPHIPYWLPENLWSGMYFEDMILSAKKWVKIIQEREKPDVIVGSFHAGVDWTYGGGKIDELANENATELVARQVSGFDVIYSGHDHYMWNKTVKNPDGKDVLLLGGSNAGYSVQVATIDLTYDSTKKTYSKSISGLVSNLVSGNQYTQRENVAQTDGTIKLVEKYTTDSTLNSRLQNSSAYSAYMTKFDPQYQAVSKYVSEQVGTFAGPINTRVAMFGDSAFVDIVHAIQLDLTKADISFSAPLALNMEINAGPVYVSDMFKLYVYENLLYTMKMTGKEIKDYLEFNYDMWMKQMANSGDHLINFKALDETKTPPTYTLATNYYNYDTAAGIKYTVDVSKPKGSRVSITSMSNGAAFDLAKEYKVAINSYRGTGGGNHMITGAGIKAEDLPKRIIAGTDRDLRYYLKDWIKKTGTVNPVCDNNWKIIPETWAAAGMTRDWPILFPGAAVGH